MKVIQFYNKNKGKMHACMHACKSGAILKYLYKSKFTEDIKQRYSLCLTNVYKIQVLILRIDDLWLVLGKIKTMTSKYWIWIIAQRLSKQLYNVLSNFRSTSDDKMDFIAKSP